MQEPEPHRSTKALINHIRTRYHDAHRRDLPALVALAREAEKVHPGYLFAQTGLADALETMRTELEAHMRREEEVVFPAIRSGAGKSVATDIDRLRCDHDRQEIAVNRVAAITQGFRPPDGSGPKLHRLYNRLGKLAEDLDEHRYLEDVVLFPRFEART